MFLTNSEIFFDLIVQLIQLFIYILFLLISVAFFTLGERKLMGSVQRRKGPDVMGFWGILQPMADGLKLVLKELLFPYRASISLFIVGPLLVFVFSSFGWFVIPLNGTLSFGETSFPLIFNFMLGSLNVYGLVISGWSSNSRYAYLGGIRATAQMISYELILGMINVIIILVTGSFDYGDIVTEQQSLWNIFLLFPVFILYLIVMLAETNRTPFDLAEAEAEPVAGYNVEYSSIMFALFFLGEYANMLLLSILCVIFFLGGWSVPFKVLENFAAFLFIGKVLFFNIFFVWVRATLPRYRYDTLMTLGWKYFLPLIFGLFMLYTGLGISLNCFGDNGGLAEHQDLLFYKYKAGR